MAFKRRTKIDLGILVVVLVLGVIGAKNAVTIGDWFRATFYKPSVEISALAESATMTETGKKLFYRYSPQIVDQQTMQAACGKRVGCITGRSIYIIESKGVKEVNRNIVTAGHEMLHVAYSELSPNQLRALEPLLAENLDNPANKNVATKLLVYRQNPARYFNEAHSYLGTEATTLSPQLEAHFRQYFTTRQKLLDANANSAPE